jgi:hypothetical protein
VLVFVLRGAVHFVSKTENSKISDSCVYFFKDIIDRKYQNFNCKEITTQNPLMFSCNAAFSECNQAEKVEPYLLRLPESRKERADPTCATETHPAQPCRNRVSRQ